MDPTTEHLSEETLARWTRGETSGQEDACIEAHLESCDDCALLLERVDHPTAPIVRALRDLKQAESDTVVETPTRRLAIDSAAFLAKCLQMDLLDADQLGALL
ncbi:MAG: zf-HC2 domain-containing protein, partial [Planctomycetota bacterium]